jgi:hypothetical protein
MPQDVTTNTGRHGEIGIREQRAGTVPKRTVQFLAAGSMGEAIAGGAAVVLAVLGLTGVLPVDLVSIAAICAGAALFLEGSAIASQYKVLEREISESSKTRVVLGGGMAFEVIGGLGGMTLGVLGLIGIVPAILVPVSAIVMGSTLVLAAGATERLDKARLHWNSQQQPEAEWTQWIHDSVIGSAGLQVMVGLAAATLGILALVGLAPMVLSLVAMLSLGGAVLLAGAAITGKTTPAFKG